jgi:long-chain acyl-CoA synthetase
MLKEKLVVFIEDSIKKNWDINALADYNGKSLRFSDTAEQIRKFHLLFEQSGIKRGDKIALIGNNSANWATVFLATITYGAVIVPILPDFGPDNIHHIVDHSDSIFFFVSEPIWKNLEPGKMSSVHAFFSLETYSALLLRHDQVEKSAASIDELFSKKYPDGLSPDHISFPKIENNEMALISYTSGTTGFSKGVMISHNSLTANVRYAHRNMPLEPGDSILSLLTIAHSFGMSFDFLFPFTLGCHITFLTKIPSLPVLMKAFGEIRPKLILLVPLLPEKIYKKQLVPTIKKPVMRTLLKIPGINQLIYSSINKKISNVFGGNFHELVLGGAAFSKDAEAFFRKIKFPYTVGYGMTECGPLISYAPWKEAKAGSCGRVVDTLEIKIDSDDPQNTVGEIMVKGDNVMDGYYKNQEATDQVIDKDGWLRTGDLGVIDTDGFIFIRGRNKSMILRPDGKNIYPEEIEAMINSRYYILESLVVERQGQLVALIYPDHERLKTKKVKENKIEEILEDYRKKLNKRFPAHVKIAKFVLHEEEFEKTPKKSLKRYLYQEKKETKKE